MNRLNGMMLQVEHNDTLSLVDVRVGAVNFSAILLETPTTAPYLVKGAAVTLLFKETEVSLAKNLQGTLSLRNQVPARVVNIDEGDILSAVTLAFVNHRLVSVITTRAVKHLQLTVGDEVVALIKANEIVLMQGYYAY